MNPDVLVIDNYDSFTYNLVQAIGALRARMQVVRADEVDMDELRERPPDAIVISPGPGTPERAGFSMRVVSEASGRVPILGVCLGHQAIGAALGANVVRAPAVVHGKASQVSHDGSALFEGVPSPFAGGRYHSLVVDEGTLPPTLVATARSEDGMLMAIAHREHPTFGVQFHPESVMTRVGLRILKNFLRTVQS